MASPFKVFRKNQKLWIAGLVLLAMFGFVFLPTILDTMGGRQTTNPVAFKSTYGDLRESELHILRERHLRTLGILTDVLLRTGYSPALIQQQLENMFGGSTLEDAATSWLLARHAQEMGMVIGDEMINVFLQRITQDQVPVAEFHTAFKRSGVSDRMFFEMMRDELLALKLKELFLPSINVFASTPAQRWDYFCRLNREAAIEAVPVAVADFIGQIADPAEEQLRAFFEEYKNELPLPFLPQPGFKRPQKVALEYFKAETEKFAAPELISDEEVLRRYEKDKERYDKFFREPAVETPPEGAEEKPADDERPAAEKKEDVKNAEKSPQAAPAKESTPEPSSPKTEPKERSGENNPPKSSARGVQSPVVLAAFQQPAADRKASPESSAKAGPAVEKPQASAKPETSAKPAPAAAEPGPPKDEKNTAKKTAPAAPAAEPAKPSETGPSERLKESIRREIAGEKIDRIFDRLGEQVDQYREKRNEYDFSQTAAKEGKPVAPPPPKPDFENLAKQHGLSFGRTGLVAQWNAAKSEIGSALVGGGLRAWQFAFHSMAKLRPERGMDLSGNLYLFWKTEDAKEDVHKFEDDGVREEVLRAWKTVQARELAAKKAESLAAEARKAGKPLVQLFDGRPELRVVAPPPFTWMTFGSVSLSLSQQPEIGAVEGVDMPGEEFMRTVFRLEPGEVGAAMNAPQTAAYVVRLTGFSPFYKVLWEQFKVYDFRKYAAVAQEDRQQIFQAWIDEIKATAGFEWTPEHKRLGTANSGQ